MVAFWAFNEVIGEKSNISWNDIYVIESAKQASQVAAILPVNFPQFLVGVFPFTSFLMLNSESMSELELQGSSSSVGLLKGVGPSVGNVGKPACSLCQFFMQCWNSRHITKFCDGLNAMKLCDDAGKH
ncbi:hypothetical protein Tco_0974356 [Tanacetum coccineum]|uniref:Uncharacterized protein n=1 Tax=Tanacetum coccineum TaxID=301880 RepID=A0ABQ5EBB8_9ASTR